MATAKGIWGCCELEFGRFGVEALVLKACGCSSDFCNRKRNTYLEPKCMYNNGTFDSFKGFWVIVLPI